MDLTESELPKLCVKLIKQNTIYLNISGCWILTKEFRYQKYSKFILVPNLNSVSKSKYIYEHARRQKHAHKCKHIH